MGANDGTHKKQRYFECRDHHGVFVRPSDILCVTQRKVGSGCSTCTCVRMYSICTWKIRMLCYVNLILTGETFSLRLLIKVPSNHTTST